LKFSNTKTPRWGEKRLDILTFLVRNEMFVRKYSANHIKQKIQLRFYDLKSLNNLDPSPRFPLRNLLKYIYTGVINSFLNQLLPFQCIVSQQTSMKCVFHCCWMLRCWWFSCWFLCWVLFICRASRYMKYVTTAMMRK